MRTRNKELKACRWKCELHLKGATFVFGLQQDCPSYRQSWKDWTADTGSTLSTGENIRESFQLHLKGATFVYGLQQDCPSYRQSWKDWTAGTGSTLSTGENIRESFQLITRRVSVVIVEFHFAEMTGDRRLANKRYYTPCKCCFEHFYKNKASHHKQRQLNWPRLWSFPS